MGTLLPQLQKTTAAKVTQVTGTASTKTFDALDHLLLVVPEDAPESVWRALPDSKVLTNLLQRRKPKSVPAFSTRMTNKRHTAIHVATVDPKTDSFLLLSMARKLVAAATSEKSGTVGIWVHGFDGDDHDRLVRHIVAAALAATFVAPAFKAKPVPPAVDNVRVIGLPKRMDLDRVVAEAEANNVARYLTGMPANKLDAKIYADLLQDMAAAENWTYRKLGVKQLQKLGAGAFLAVAQGNGDDSASIIHLKYRPGKSTLKPELTLIGKGIVFDTGGVNLKPFNSMLDMHIDMGGSAVAVGTLLTISRLGLDIPVDCWLAITENRIGPLAYKPQDVVTAINGKTIQTVHTDAEGRMALADTLALASRDKPGVMIDYATLTGACMNAVTTRYSGVFTNRPDFHPLLRKAGQDSGERVWPFPVGKEFLEELKSETADLQQCSPNGGGDHILAASFLQEFVDEDVPWIHVDLSACKRKGGLGHVPTDITGFGVRFSMELIIDKDILAAGRNA